MEQFKTAICRLCLKKCVDFTAVEDCMKDVLDVLLLKINLTVSEEPVMCTNCAAMLINCFDFKATCFYTHDYLVPFLDDKKISKLDLKKVYRSKHGNVDIPENRSVCGFCMGLLKKCTALSLDNEKGNMLEKMMRICLPELDFSTIEEPIICVACYESLKTYSHVVWSCLIVEEEIKEYRRITGTDVIEIADVLQLTSSNVSRVEDDNKIDIISEAENLCVDSANADEQAAPENASFANMEEQKLLLNEDIEIKTDQLDFDRCLGGVVSSQPLATRSRGGKKCSVSKGGPLKINYQCASCSFQTKYKSNLKTHKLTHKDPSEVTMYQCASCSFQTKHKAALYTHVVTHKLSSETTMYQCDSCSHQTKHKHSLNRHKLTHKDPSEVTMYQCASCSYQTKRKRNLQNHILTHKNPSEVTMYQCKSCSFQTKHRAALNSHMIVHKLSSETTMYQCDSCDFKTKYKRNLYGHKLTHNDPSEITILQCESCDFKTKEKRSLRAHLLTHKYPSEVTLHKCESCPYQTIHKHNLPLHMIIHKDPSEVTMYQCASCSFQTKRKHHLRRHNILTHKDPSQITMYQCESCSFKTKHKHNMNAHDLIHKDPSEITMYQCPSCSFQTKYKSGIRKHMKIHGDDDAVV